MSDSPLSYADIIKKFPDVFTSGQQLVENPRSTISVSPAFDIAVGDGILEGGVITLAGRAGCGKTTLGLQMLANAQLPENNVTIKGKSCQRKVVYINSEHRLKEMNLKGIHNLNYNNVEVIQSTRNKELSAEEILNILHSLLRLDEYYGAFFLVDSVSALCPFSEMVGDVSGQVRSTGPKIMSSFLKKNSGAILSNRAVIICIHHLITNTSGYGETLMIDGGVKIEFANDIRLISKSKPQKWESDGKLIGQATTWTCLKASGTNSGKEFTSYIRYGYGIDSVQELVTLAVDLGVIEKGGAWFNFVNEKGEKVKFQGQDKVYKHMLENKEDFKLIENRLKSILVFSDDEDENEVQGV